MSALVFKCSQMDGIACHDDKAGNIEKSNAMGRVDYLLPILLVDCI